MAGIAEKLNADIASMVDDVRRGMVRIQNGRRGVGAGTVWHPEGLILTNAHVVHRDTLRVTLYDGRTAPARVLAWDSERDLAALSVELSGLPSIELGDSRGLKPGQVVFALGFPWGVEAGLTAGVVIGFGTQVPGRRSSGRDWLAASLHLRPGHSGGPLVDARGQLIGLNTMMNGPDVGVAVPVHSAREFLREKLHRDT